MKIRYAMVITRTSQNAHIPYVVEGPPEGFRHNGKYSLNN